MHHSSSADVHVDVTVTVRGVASAAGLVGGLVGGRARCTVLVRRGTPTAGQPWWLADEPAITVTALPRVGVELARIERSADEGDGTSGADGQAGECQVDLDLLEPGAEARVETDFVLPDPSLADGWWLPDTDRELARIAVTHWVEDPLPGAAHALTATFAVRGRVVAGAVELGVSAPAYELSGLEADTDSGSYSWTMPVDVVEQRWQSGCGHTWCFGDQVVADDQMWVAPPEVPAQRSAAVPSGVA